MDITVRIEVEISGEEARRILREILRGSTGKEHVEVTVERKRVEPRSDIWEEQDTKIIAEAVLGYRMGRLPRAKVRLVKYLYMRGGIARYEEVAARFGGKTVRETMKSGAVYVMGRGGEKVVVLEDHAKEFLEKLYGGENGEQEAVGAGGEAQA